MTDHPVNDLDPRLAAWLGTRAPADVPAALVARVSTIPNEAGRSPLSRFRMPTRLHGRPGALLAAAMLGVAIVTVALGGLLLSSTNDPDRVASSPAPASMAPSTVPSAPAGTPAPSGPFRSSGLLPATIPDDVAHGIVDTPIGRVRWVHLQGDATTLPDPLVPIRGPDRSLAWFEDGRPANICLNGGERRPECIDPPGPRLEVSSDVLAPREARTLPVTDGVASLVESGDWYWLTAKDPAAAWRSRDLVTWEATDLSAIMSPGPAGLEWTMYSSWIVSTATATVGQFTFEPVDPGQLLGYPGQGVNLRDDGAGGYVARELHSMRDGGDVDRGAITVTEVAGALRFANAAGREVGRLEGVGMEFANAWASGNLQHDVIARLDGDRWVPVELPGLRGGATLGAVSVIDAYGSVFAYAVSPDTQVRSWRSTDGRSWTGGAVLVDDAGTPLRGGALWYVDEVGGRTIFVGRNDGGPGWRSSDGERFVVDPTSTDPVPPTWFTGGSIQAPTVTDSGSWLVSRDGSTWATAPALSDLITKIQTAGPGGSGILSLENVVFFSVVPDAGIRDLWVLEFEAPGG